MNCAPPLPFLIPHSSFLIFLCRLHLERSLFPFGTRKGKRQRDTMEPSEPLEPSM